MFEESSWPSKLGKALRAKSSMSRRADDWFDVETFERKARPWNDVWVDKSFLRMAIVKSKHPKGVRHQHGLRFDLQTLAKGTVKHHALDVDELRWIIEHAPTWLKRFEHHHELAVKLAKKNLIWKRTVHHDYADMKHRKQEERETFTPRLRIMAAMDLFEQDGHKEVPEAELAKHVKVRRQTFFQELKTLRRDRELYSRGKGRPRHPRYWRLAKYKDLNQQDGDE